MGDHESAGRQAPQNPSVREEAVTKGKPLPLFDAAAARAARDKGIDRVLRHWSGWQAKAYEAIDGIRQRKELVEFTGEDIREKLLAIGIGPAAPQAWGAFIGNLKRDKIIIQTGDLRPMKATKSHARQTFVYRFSNGK